MDEYPCKSKVGALAGYLAPAMRAAPTKAILPNPYVLARTPRETQSHFMAGSGADLAGGEGKDGGLAARKWGVDGPVRRHWKSPGVVDLST